MTAPVVGTWDVTGFDPLYITAEGTLLLTVDVDNLESGKLQLVVDSALVEDLALALVTKVIEAKR